MGEEKYDLAIREIRQKFQPEIKKLVRVKNWKTIWGLSFCWSIIFLSVFVSEFTNSLIVYIFSVFVIAARQHGLLALVHEGTHGRLWKTPFLNDWIAELCAAYPLLFNMRTYRSSHWVHHKYNNTDRDPSWVYRICHEEWQFPMNSKKLLSYYKKFFLGFGFLDMLINWRMFSGLSPKNLRESDDKLRWVPQVIYYAVVFLILNALGGWEVFLKYWVIPMLFVLPILMRIRDVAEHFGLPNEHELNGTRNVLCPVWERFFIMPFNTSLHLDHHLFPTVPYYNLPKLHELLKTDRFYVQHAHENDSYLGFGKKSMIKELIRKKS